MLAIIFPERHRPDSGSRSRETRLARSRATHLPGTRTGVPTPWFRNRSLAYYAGRPIIIIKKKDGHYGHHGGAWKVAYADFVAAMMALFIVLDSKPHSDKRNYGNGELSTDRANSARRLMQQDGPGRSRSHKCAASPTNFLRKPKDPFDPSNRRISLIVDRPVPRRQGRRARKDCGSDRETQDITRDW